jgi:predicted ATPase
MPVYFVKRCMRFTLRGFSEEIPPFAANVLGAREALLSVLAHFFEHGRWGSPVEADVEGQSLTAEDQLYILMLAALYLTVTQGSTASEVQICYERAEYLCYSLNRRRILYVVLMGQWRYSLRSDGLTAAMEIAQRVYSLAKEENDSVLMIGACQALAVTLYNLGDIETARKHTTRGVQLWRSGGLQPQVEEVDAPIVALLCFEAIVEWHTGEIASCHATMAEATSLAKDLNDMHALAVAIFWAAILGYYEYNPAQVEHCASDLSELATRHNFRYWLACGAILRGWARSASGDTAGCISWIEDGIRDNQATGARIGLPLFLALKAEALHLVDRTSEALEAIREAEALTARSGERYWCAELYRLRGVFLAALGANEAQIEASFFEAIRTANQQKSISLAKRAEATYAEYRRQKKERIKGAL